MRRIIVCLIFTACINTCQAQYFQFSQYNFTPQRINPGQVSDSDYARIAFDYRNQATDGGFHLTSNMLNVSYPLISRSGKRWSGIGMTFMDDRSGQAGIFNTQEVGLTYALNVSLAKYQTLSLGVKGLYQNRKIDLGGLYTGAQYVPDRGFSEALASGENMGQFNTDFVTFSAGLYWQQLDNDGAKLAYWGISFFDFNKPENSFFGLQSHLNSTFVGSLGFRAFSKGNVSIFPEILYTRSAATNLVNAGCITRFDLKTSTLRTSASLHVITKYVLGRSGIVGLQIYKENLTVGLSYDFPLLATNVANTGAVEVGVELRKLVIPQRKNANNKRRKSKNISPLANKQNSNKALPITIVTPEKQSEANRPHDTVGIAPVVKADLSSRLKAKQDSIKTTVEAGQFKHEPLVLEKATLDFTFDFNSAEVSKETARYLTELAQALKDNRELNVKLIGHTDNVGSEKFNLRLSFYRAQKMKDYLVANGVQASRISVDGKGMTEPLNDNSTDNERALNRRVELTILYDN